MVTCLSQRQFTCLALLASALLTRGLEAARADADEPSVTLIARHDYCTQEAVNLLLLGRATSNVFDGNRRVGQLRLRGLRASDQPDVGFLALLEASGAMEVGRALKNPRWPVFVVQAESHFLVLFARSALATRGPLDLFFLDGLALQEHHVVVGEHFPGTWSQLTCFGRARRATAGLNRRTGAARARAADQVAARANHVVWRAAVVRNKHLLST